MATPRWLRQLAWSPAYQIPGLDTGRLPPGAGLYTFTRDVGVLSSHNVLYVGKADGARQTLRTRVGVYLRRFAAPPGGQPSRHAGMEQLAEYYGAHGGLLYVRWAGVIVARDIEGSLIDLFDPPFNNKDEHRRGFGDGESIPDDMLYTWP